MGLSQPRMNRGLASDDFLGDRRGGPTRSPIRLFGVCGALPPNYKPLSARWIVEPTAKQLAIFAQAPEIFDLLG